MTTTPLQQAEELIHRFRQYTPAEEEFEFVYAVKCAIINVDTLINEHTFKNPIKWNIERKEYWLQVKKELQNKLI